MKEQIEIDLDKACTLARQLADEGENIAGRLLLSYDRRRHMKRLLAEASETILRMSRALLMLARQTQREKDNTSDDKAVKG